MSRISMFFIWIFCVVILLLPTQNLFFSLEKERTCCVVQNGNHKEGRECCYNSPFSSKKKSEKKHCEGRHLKICTSCISVFTEANKSNISSHCPYIFINKEVNSSYLSPYVLTATQKIWHPPKISV